MKLLALPAFSDNYIWLLHDGHQAIVVDPGEAAPVVAALQQHQLQLQAIVITHHHHDHIDGVEALYQQCGNPQTQVLLPAGEGLQATQFPTVPSHAFHWVSANTAPKLLGATWQVFDVPGHTAGHVAYYVAPPSQAPMLFCGDTLFSGGCGRLFEGSPAQMYHSLQQLAALPNNTLVCCAHEYTASNLRFALAVEPHNTELQRYEQRCTALRAQGHPTLPSSLQLELAINPFLRVDQADVQQAARQHTPSAHSAVEVFAALREWKNHF